MKYMTIKAMAIIAMAMLSVACSDDDTEIEETFTFEEGEEYVRSFSVGDEEVVSITETMVNFGTADLPVLLPVATSHTTVDGYYNILQSMTQEEIELFAAAWADIKGMPMSSEQEIAEVYYDLWGYFYSNYIDMQLFVRLLIDNNDSVADVLSYVNQTRADSGSDSINKALFYRYTEGKEVAYLDAEAEQSVETKSSITSGSNVIIGIINAIEGIYDTAVQLSQVSDGIAEAVDNTSSWVSDYDKNPDNYSGGTYFKTSDYKFKYSPIKINYGKFTFHIEGYYGDKYKNETANPGSYISKIYINTTEAAAKGPGYVSTGTFQYAQAINISDEANSPVVEAEGVVNVTYGDCCCYRYFATLTFKVRAATTSKYTEGFEQVAYSNKR